MTTITIPAELEAPLAEAAKQQGTTPELLAVESLRRMYAPKSTSDGVNGQTLADFLKGYVATVAGSSEPWSEQTGKGFRHTP
jgi:hypothetical protein